MKTAMKVEIGHSKMDVLTVRDVANLLVAGELEPSQKIGRVELEDEVLGVEILEVVDGDPRCSDYSARTDSFTVRDIEDSLTGYAHLCWANEEGGEDILLCFNAN